MIDLISREAALNCFHSWVDKYGDAYTPDEMPEYRAIEALPSAQPEIIQCKDCKHNPKESWFGCPMSHLSEEQRPGTAWCWKGERKDDE